MSLDVPLDSFTAFRLKYCTPEEMERSSTVVRLGPVPNAWLLDKKSMLLAKLYRLDNASYEPSAGSMLQETFETSKEAPIEKEQMVLGLGNSSVTHTNRSKHMKTGNTIRRKLGFGPAKSREKSLNEEASLTSLKAVETETGDVVSALPNFHRSGSQILKQKTAEELKILHTLYEPSDTEEVPLEREITDPYMALNNSQTATTITTNEDSEITLKSNSPLSKHNQRLETIKRKMYQPEDLNNDIELAKQKLAQSHIMEHSESMSKSVDSFVTANESFESIESKHVVIPEPVPVKSKKMVEFKSVNMRRAMSSRGSYIYTFESKKLPLRRVDQVPCKDFEKEYEASMVKEMEKSLEGSSSEEEDDAFSTMPIKRRSKPRYAKFLREYKPGEIIKMNKALVLVTARNKIRERLIENTSSETILDRWREYLIVARYTGNEDFPVLLQFYKTNKVIKNDESQVAEKDFALELESRLEQDQLDSAFNDLKEMNDRQKNRRKHKKHRARACHFKIPISKADTKVGFSDLLDRALRLTKDHKRLYVSYIILFHSSLTSVTWLNLLQVFTEEQRKEDRETAFIVVPSLDISFTIRHLSKLCKIELESTCRDTLNVQITSTGYNIARAGLIDNILTAIEENINKYLSVNGRFMADKDGVTRFLGLLKSERRALALSLRKYDRLEWLVGDQESLKYSLWTILGAYFELELREFVHDDHYLLQNMSRCEPLPIEGFIVRLCNHKGKLKSHLGRYYFKLLYAHTCNNILFFQHFFHSVPILGAGAKDLITPNGNVLNMAQLESCCRNMKSNSETYKPYPLDEKGRHISWLKEDVSTDTFRDKDRDALHEAERRSALIANSSTMIDLCNISDVQAVDHTKVSKLVRAAGLTVWNIDEKPLGLDSGHHIHKHKLGKSASKTEAATDSVDNVFEIVLKDGNRVRFQVSCSAVRDEWIRRLLDMSSYWKLKQAENVRKEIALRKMNSSLSTVNDEAVGTDSKWEYTNARADESIYSISAHSLDKPVLISGVIYSRLKDTDVFLKHYMVLSPGFLTIYEMYKRSKLNKGSSKIGVYYKKASTLALSHCYVFAGNLNGSHGKLKDRGGNIEKNSTPLLYQEGFRSDDPQRDRVFSVWFGSKRLLMRSLKQGKQAGQISQRHDFNMSDMLKRELEDDTEDETGSDSEDDSEEDSESSSESLSISPPPPPVHIGVWDMVKVVSKLGTRGKIMTFLAASKLSRDVWVTRLKGEIDRCSLHREGDIDVV